MRVEGFWSGGSKRGADSGWGFKGCVEVRTGVSLPTPLLRVVGMGEDTLDAILYREVQSLGQVRLAKLGLR